MIFYDIYFIPRHDIRSREGLDLNYKKNRLLNESIIIDHCRTCIISYYILRMYIYGVRFIPPDNLCRPAVHFYAEIDYLCLTIWKWSSWCFSRRATYKKRCCYYTRLECIVHLLVVVYKSYSPALHIYICMRYWESQSKGCDARGYSGCVIALAVSECGRGVGWVYHRNYYSY